jgi:hypothetical protein
MRQISTVKVYEREKCAALFRIFRKGKRWVRINRHPIIFGNTRTYTVQQEDRYWFYVVTRAKEESCQQPQ